MSAAPAASSSTSTPSDSKTPYSPPPLDPNHAQLYINNMAFSTTKDELTQWVEAKIGGKSVESKIVTRTFRNKERPLGFGFVTIPKDKLKLGLELNKTQLGGREVGVQEAKQKTDEERQEQRQKRDEKRAEFKAKREAAKASKPAAPAGGEKKKSEEKKEKPHSDEKKAEAKPKKTFENATQLYVNNLPFSVTPEQLSKLFEDKTGQKPLEVDLVESRFGKYKGSSRGFGFVTVGNAVSAKALELNATKVEEREIGVQIAKPKEPRPERENHGERPRKTPAGDDASGTENADGNGEGGRGGARRGRGRGRGRGRPRGTRKPKEGGNSEGNTQK